MHYLLDENKEPYEVSIEEAVKLYDDLEMKIVKQDKLDDGTFISTVFLGMDHGWWDERKNHNYKPVLFETMIFGGEYDQYQERYTTYQKALEGHEQAIKLAKQKLIDDGNNPTETSS